MDTSQDLITGRAEFCNQQLTKLRAAVSELPDVEGLDDLCIYVTGSYGRFEASQESDLDLFFVRLGSKETNSISKIQKTLMDAALIKKCRELGYPDFSGYGEYLEVHYLDDMIQHLGSPDDDYQNLFTARLLLLLESTWIYNEKVYKKVLEEIISTYFRDYHDHEKDFLPLFLVNDIIRFWKTLCLNYEHRRNRQTDNLEEKNNTHLKNLKLKFSRLMTCFSAISELCAVGSPQTHSHVLEIVQTKPIDRIKRLEAIDTVSEDDISKIIEQYKWFMEFTGQPKSAQIENICDRSNRDLAFDRARTFGESMHRLISNSAAGTDTLRYLMI